MPEGQASSDAKPSPRLGSYVLTQQLGSGGMSNVFRAVHEETGNVVAVKVLPRTLAKNVTLLQRFIREAKSAESLDHPNIVSIYDRGFDQGRHYLVLEYVEGRDLHDRVRAGGPMAAGEAIKLVRQVAEGLQYAAGRGMIHRDVKPANMLMTPQGDAKIIDLGLALQTEDEDERVTRDGTTVGTVDYMSPEQARDSRKTSERSDIYSLGCTFYYLMTGSAPFPGGTLADKLARHHSAPIPDVRERNPDVPEPLALLISKMMAKKPDQRFADYADLINNLDHLAGNPPSQPLSGQPPAAALDALIVDDEDDEADDGSMGLLLDGPATVSNRHAKPRTPPPEPTAPYLMAEIVDDDDDDQDNPQASRPPSSSPGQPRPKPGPPRREPAAPAELSLAELAALDADDEPKARSSRKIPVLPPSKSSSPVMDALVEDDDDDEEVYGGGGHAPPRGSGQELSLKSWVAAGVLVGLAIAIVGLGVSLLISYSKPTPPEIAERKVDDPPPGDPEAPSASGPTPPVVPRGPTGPSRPIPKAPVTPGPKPKDAPPPVVTAEASPVVAAPLVERSYPADWEARLLPTLVAPSIRPDPRPGVVVRRVTEPGDELQTASIAIAFGRPVDVVEIADNGPFFEDDCQIAGKSKTIRARPGTRPMIKVELSENPVVKEQEAKFILGGGRVEQLTFEGIDLVVDVRELPAAQLSLFLCRGADLTLRDCSITLLGSGVRTFSMFRLIEGARPNRVTLERTTIRGPVRSLFDVIGARAEVILDRSVIVGESGPLISIEAAERARRSLHLNRSVIATRGPLIEFEGRTTPMTIRSLGSTFARVDAAVPASLLHSRMSFAGEASGWLDWSGEDNSFVGWPSLLSSGVEATPRVANLDALHSQWAGTDATSQEVSTPWPGFITRDDITPLDLAALVPDRKPSLARVAAPQPRLREQTSDSIKRQPSPDLVPGMINNAMIGGRTLPWSEVAFDVNAPPFNGDLGQFLAAQVKDASKRHVIRVRGGGVHPTSPFKIPDGASVSIIGEATEGSKNPMPTFTPRPEAAGKSVIELQGGDLAIANLAFFSDGTIRPKAWVRVTDGLLGMRHCRFRDTGGLSAAGECAVAISAPSVSPIPGRSGPLAVATDRPTARLQNCLIWTGADALNVEMGRGVVDLSNCLILSGGPAVTLRPSKVAAAKFEADLAMENCTIADDRTAIQLAAWPGEPGGPARPWLIWTRNCVFPRTQKEGPAALLTVDPEAFAHGVLFWQSFRDSYEVGRFVISAGPQPAAPPPGVDFKKQWVGLWGNQHTKGDRGPDPRRTDHVLRYREKERPKPGRYYPNALELDPKVHKDDGVAFKDLPPIPSR